MNWRFSRDSTAPIGKEYNKIPETCTSKIVGLNKIYFDIPKFSRFK